MGAGGDLSTGAVTVAVVGGLLRGSLGSVFVAASAHKALRPTRFKRAVRGYALVPSVLVGPTAWAMIGVEFMIGVSLLFSLAPAVMLAAAAVVLAVLAGAVAINLVRGRTIDCGCSVGTTPQIISWGLVARNVVLVGVCAAMGYGSSVVHGPPWVVETFYVLPAAVATQVLIAWRDLIKVTPYSVSAQLHGLSRTPAIRPSGLPHWLGLPGQLQAGD